MQIQSCSVFGGDRGGESVPWPTTTGPESERDVWSPISVRQTFSWLFSADDGGRDKWWAVQFALTEVIIRRDAGDRGLWCMRWERMGVEWAVIEQLVCAWFAKGELV